MSLPDLIPAHFLSSSLHDDLLTSYAPKKTQAQTQSKPSTPVSSRPSLNRRVTSPSRGPSSPTTASAHAHAAPQAIPRRARALSNQGPLPAPIGIPAARRRSPSVSAALSRPPLSSSPTHTPFSVTPVNGEPRLGSPVSPIRIPRTPSPARPTLSTSVASTTSAAQPASPPSPSSPKLSPKISTTANGNGRAASPTGSSPSSPKKRAWGRFFDFDHMLGALDPNRVAAATCPEPVKTVVFGAETETGLAVCRALIAAKHYAITALTVDEECPAADELRAQGVRVVVADMDSPISYARELVGAKAVYLSSNVLALHAILHHQQEPKRTDIARAADRCQLSKAVKACHRAKVGHVVFRVNACGHEVVENVLGKSRAEPKVVMDAPEDLDRLGIMHTVLHTTVPFNRITEWLEDGPNGLVLNVPVPDDTAMPLFPLEQTGEYVLAALRNPKRWAGKEMHAIAEVMTPMQIAAHLSKLSRRPVDTMHPTRDEFMSFESHERLACRWDAWAQLVRHEYVPDEVAKATKQDVPDEMDFKTWIAQDEAIHQRLKF